MRISQLAERSGVPPTTLRFYETAGLLAPDRTPAGYRIYDDDALARLSLITAAKTLGLSLDEIAELLKVWTSGTCTDVKSDLRPRVAAHLAEADHHIAELTALTTALRRTLTHLDALPDRQSPCAPDCGFPPAPPVACTLTRDEATDRAAHWHRLLSGATRAPIENGIRLTIPATRAPALTTLAIEEQHCCPFLAFHLHLDGPVAHLEVRAPSEATQTLTDLFGPAPRPLVRPTPPMR